MKGFGLILSIFTLVTSAFVGGVLLTVETTIYKLGQESNTLIEQCELSLPRDQFCELIAKPQENKHVRFSSD